ncbi:hypothetical protein K1719_008231 [Acacia pycnantha]|nr:hypothetical protein K1719_008231 [Acacia pycnantha]
MLIVNNLNGLYRRKGILYIISTPTGRLSWDYICVSVASCLVLINLIHVFNFYEHEALGRLVSVGSRIPIHGEGFVARVENSFSGKRLLNSSSWGQKNIIVFSEGTNISSCEHVSGGSGAHLCVERDKL